MTPDKELKKAIEEIGIATYGGRSFEATGMYRDKLTVILNTYAQSYGVLDEVGVLDAHAPQADSEIRGDRGGTGVEAHGGGHRCHW